MFEVEYVDPAESKCGECGSSFGVHLMTCSKFVRQKTAKVWEVWQGSSLICSAQMKLTEAQARSKVENEARNGVLMEARPTTLAK